MQALLPDQPDRRGQEKAEAVRIGFSEIEQMICSGFREDEIGQLAGQLLRIKENLLK